MLNILNCALQNLPSPKTGWFTTFLKKSVGRGAFSRACAGANVALSDALAALAWKYVDPAG